MLTIKPPDGDIGVKDTAELEASYKAKGIQVQALSSPFFDDSSLNASGHKIWQDFKNNQSSAAQPLPFEAKINGIFIGLRKRYGNNLAYLGWRSGSLDVPAFLGSPIFSLDNKIAEDERSEQSGLKPIKDLDPPYDPRTLSEEGRYKAQETSRKAAYAKGNELWKICFEDEKYLWDLTRYGAGPRTSTYLETTERMEAISASASTWITINSPLRYGQNDNPLDVRPYQVKSFDAAIPNHDVLRLEEAKHALAVAVAVWLCCEDKADDQPLWTKRHHLLREIATNKWLVDLFEHARKL